MSISVNKTFPVISCNTLSVCHKASVEADIIVPDTKPDILKVLNVSENAYINSDEAQESRVLLSGNVDFCVIYLADDEQRSICSLRVTAPFSEMCEGEKVTPESKISSSVEKSSSSFKLQNCRKLSLKADLGLLVEATNEMSPEIVDDISSAEVLKEHVTAVCLGAFSKKDVDIQDTFELPHSSKKADEILKSTAKAEITSIKAVSNKAVIRGSVFVNTLYIADGAVLSSENELPFTEIVDTENLNGDMDIKGDVSVKNVVASLCDDGENDGYCVNISFTLTFTVKGCENVEFDSVKDAFLPHGALKTDTNTISYTTPVKTASSEHFIKASLTVFENLPDIENVCEVCAAVTVEKSEDLKNSLTVYGNLDVSVLYSSNDSSSPINTFNEKIPFTHTVKKDSCDIGEAVAHARLLNISFSVSSSRSIDVRANVLISASCSETQELTYIENAEETEFQKENRPSIIISYVKEDDTPWSIAKKHNIKVSDLKSVNLIDKDELEAGCPLIIPR